MASEIQHAVGRSKAALTVGRSRSQKAVIIFVNAEPTHKDNQRVFFKGVVKFSKSTRDHVRRIIIPLLDRILEELGLCRPGLVISATNLSVASVSDVGIDISGFSADTSVFLSLLSQCLGISLADNVLTTGHIASRRGDIKAVKGIPAKLDAAISDASIHWFIYPDPDSDRSLEVLSPGQRDIVTSSVTAARDSIKTKGVRGINELLKAVFTEQAIVLASLRQGFFGRATFKDTCDDPVSDAVFFLADANETRLWRLLRQHLVSGGCERAKSLLLAYVDFFLRRQIYPLSIGQKLYRLICSVPPNIRRLNIVFPIIDTGLCIKLSQYAAQSDYPDVLQLFDAVHGKNISPAMSVSVAPVSDITETADPDCLAFDKVTSTINAQALAHKFGIPADTARGSFVLESSTVQSWDQFIDILQAFVIHLHNCAGLETERSLDTDRTHTETLALLEQAFQNKGGSQAAFVKSRDGTEGGMRSVLDDLTEHYKSKQQLEYIQCVFKNAIDALDWNDRVRFIGGALKRLGPLLPPEIKEESPEQFVRGYEMIVQAYVQSLDRIEKVVRAL